MAMGRFWCCIVLIKRYISVGRIIYRLKRIIHLRHIYSVKSFSGWCNWCDLSISQMSCNPLLARYTHSTHSFTPKSYNWRLGCAQKWISSFLYPSSVDKSQVNWDKPQNPYIANFQVGRFGSATSIRDLNPLGVYNLRPIALKKRNSNVRKRTDGGRNRFPSGPKETSMRTCATTGGRLATKTLIA